MQSRLTQHLEKIPHFMEVAAVGSIQKASESIGIAQSALSKSVRIFEESTGHVLFERGRHGVQLTESGEIVLEFCRRVIEAIDIAGQELEGNLAGTIKFGTYEFYTGYIYPKIFSVNSVVAPKLSFDLTASVRAADLIQLLVAMQVDLVMAIESECPSTIVREKLYSDEYSYYGAFQKQKKDFDQVFYISGSKCGDEKDLETVLRENRRIPDSSFRVNSYASIIPLVSSGLGVGILPTKPAEFYVKKKLIRRIANSHIKQTPHDVCLYFRKSSLSNPKIQFFIDNVVKAAF